MDDQSDDASALAAALFFIARQQVLSTAMLAVHGVTSGATSKEAALELLEELAGAAERDCSKVEALGKAYAGRLRHYAKIFKMGRLPGPDLSVIDGGLKDLSD